MLKNRSEQIDLLVRTLDVCVCVGAFFGAYWIRSSGMFSGALGVGSVEGLESVSWMLAASLVLHFILYPYVRFYESLRLKTPGEIIRMVMIAFITEFFVLGTLVFLLQAKSTSRYFFGLYLALNYGLILAEKLGARVTLSTIRRRGYNYRQILIAGTGKNARRVVQALRRNKHWGYIPSALLREPGSSDPTTEIDGVQVIGELSELAQVARMRTVDEVFFALERIDSDELQQYVALSQALGIPARFSLGLFDLPASKITFSNLESIPVMTLYTTLMTPAEAFVKRVMDIGIAVVGLVITAILFPWIYLRIRSESPGPVIFKQVRVGENGRRFKCYKFRTMVADADARKGELSAANQMQGPLFKIENDPRITRFGAFLRRTSLDELPQFFNILRGDMSVVGTRPPTPDEVTQYETHFKRRLSIRPGLTGLWQVSGRNEIKRFEDVLALDLQYIDRWSIWLDVKIIFRTIWVAVFRRGAY